MKIFVSACSTSTKYWPPSTIWRFLLELVLLLLNTDCFQQFEDFFQNLFYFLLKTDHFQQFGDFSKGLFYFYQILTAFNNLEIFVSVCSTSTKYWPPSTIWRILSEFALLLLNTDHFQQLGDFCQSLVFYQILTSFNNLKILSELVLLLPNTDSFQQFEDFVRSCSTSTKYWQPSTIWRFLSEIVLLPNTDRLQQFEDFCQSLFYFY